MRDIGSLLDDEIASDVDFVTVRRTIEQILTLNALDIIVAMICLN